MNTTIVPAIQDKGYVKARHRNDIFAMRNLRWILTTFAIVIIVQIFIPMAMGEMLDNKTDTEYTTDLTTESNVSTSIEMTTEGSTLVTESSTVTTALETTTEMTTPVPPPEPIGEIRYTSFAQNITVYWNETRQAEGYVVKLDSSETIFTDETEYTFTDLAPGRRYYITVCGCQQCDEDPRITGNCSSVSAITKLAKPVNIAVTAALDIFYVEWKSSLPDNNNDDVTYNVTWKHEEDSDDHECSVRDLKANCSLEKDGRGEMHTVSVTTIADGRKMEDCGGQCQVEHFATPGDVASFNVSVEDGTNNITLTWEEPSCGSYTYYNITGGSKEWTATHDEKSKSVQLEHNLEYHFTIYTISNSTFGREMSTGKMETVWTYPDKVKKLMVTEQTSDSLTVEWEHQPQIKHYILVANNSRTDYRCNLTPEETSLKTPSDNCSRLEIVKGKSKCVVKNLEPCSKYNITVMAVNNAGQGLHNEQEGSTNKAAPVDRVVITGLEPSVNTMVASWKRPQKPSQCDIDSYKLEYTYRNCTTSTPEIMAINTNETSYTVEGLQPYWNYNFTVTAFINNEKGNSPSNTSSARTLGSEPSARPRNLRVENVTHNKAFVSWDEPDPCGHNGDSLTYNISTSCVDKVTNIERNWENKTDVPEHLVVVEPYSECNISVQAVNVNGTGPTADNSTITKEWYPGQPLLMNYSRSFNITEVEWDRPERPNGIITKYIVKYGDENRPTPFTNISIVVNECYNYSLQVAAFTKVGRGIWSNHVEAEAKVHEPLAVTNLTVVRDKRQVNITWKKPTERTGPTNYTLTVGTEIMNVEGYDTEEAIVGGLRPYVLYNITVTTHTCEWLIDSTTKKVRTLPDKPGAVGQANVVNVNDNCTAFTATWNATNETERNGNITHYVIIILLENGKVFAETTESAVESKNNYSTILNVKAEMDYYFKFFAVNQEGNGTKADVSLRSQGACAPALPKSELDDVSGIVSPTDFDQPSYPWYQIKVSMKRAFFEDNSQGKVVEWGVIVADTEQIKEEERRGKRYSEKEFSKKYNRTWRAAKSEEAMPPYRINLTQSRGKRIQKRASEGEVEQITIGTEIDCLAYCNGKLKSGRTYSVKGYTCTTGGCTVSAYSKSAKTDVVGPNVGTIVAGVLVPVVLILVVAFMLVYMQRRNMGPWRAKNAKPVGPDMQMGIQNNGLDTADIQPSPQLLMNFPHHVANRHKNSDLIFSEEFKLLKDLSPHISWNSAELTMNRAKNRYTNILPFDHSRVKLLAFDDEDEAGSDFINANYMPGYNSKREFIAAQGPLPGTKDDFWRMIWEQHVSIIVMVTNCVEKGRHKCDQYWSSDNEPIFYGDIQVQVRSESVLDNYTIRILDISMGETKRTLKHFHFTTWPDFGCPDTTQALLNFVFAVRSHRSGLQNGPVLIHCSAGVGRTGTFICTDRLLQHMRDHDEIDVFGTILEMRKYRCNMVQSEDQYVYIHDCLNDALQQNLHMKYPMYRQQPPALNPAITEIPLDPTDDQMANAVYEEITHANGHIKDPNAFEV